MKRIVILALFSLSGCDEAGPELGESAGPPVTESSPPYREWSVDPAPVARIGAVEGSPEEQFSRIAYAARLSDGGFVVVDGASNEVRWFGPGGEFDFKAGGPGEGPGEFSRIVAATVTPHDSIVLYDARNQRLTWVASDGTLSRTLRIELQGEVALVPLAGVLVR